MTDAEKRTAALEKEMMSAAPGTVAYKAVNGRVQESWTVKSHVVGNGRFDTWDKGQEQAASVSRYDHKKMREEIHKIYTQGRENPDHGRSR